MADQLSDEFVKEIRETFELFDINKDGTIDAEELGLVFQSLGQVYTEDELLDIIQDFDLSKNKGIAFEDFLELMKKRFKDIDTEEELIEAFKVFDRDASEKITHTELKYVFKMIGEVATDDDIRLIIEAGDEDKDGCLNFQEFCNMMVEK